MSVKYERYVTARSESSALYEETRAPWLTDAMALANRTDRFPTAYKITVGEVEEEPRCWLWAFNPDTGFKRWEEAIYGPVEIKHLGNGVWSVRVYGTTADRDAKRDALLAAARAAGKEPQP